MSSTARAKPSSLPGADGYGFPCPSDMALHDMAADAKIVGRSRHSRFTCAPSSRRARARSARIVIYHRPSAAKPSSLTFVADEAIPPLTGDRESALAELAAEPARTRSVAPRPVLHRVSEDGLPRSGRSPLTCKLSLRRSIATVNHLAQTRGDQHVLADGPRSRSSAARSASEMRGTPSTSSGSRFGAAAQQEGIKDRRIASISSSVF